MKEPSLPATTFFSFLVHLTFIFIALITIKNANHFTLPSAYIVSLVAEISELPARGKEGTAAQTEEPEQKMKLPSEPLKSKASEDSRQYISDRIAAIEATRKAKRVVKLRKLVSIKGADKQGKDTKEISPPAKGSANEAAILEDYFERIGKEIRQRWAFPEAWGKNLEAVISVTIMSNGVVKINKVEKSSGNVLFDRSVLRAINKASPFPPPPHGMDIELPPLRFTP
ncbi:MAG: cell envelope integrity protein TolA [Thermodesulfovibrionales bacterium]|nr:cell envelope integrity protein TolA [Nitrospinota bacterium]MCG2710254.1 cell envelope integrity protein TolA [Thermodesulfovibrionales bacterium]